MASHGTKRRLISSRRREILAQQEEILRTADPDLKVQESLAAYTTFKIGGPADFFSAPNDAASLCELVRTAQAADIPIFYLGAGSNLLIADQGIRGLVIHLRNLRAIEILEKPQEIVEPLQDHALNDDEVIIRVEVGLSLRKTAEFAAANALAGLEFTHGIPGSVGGAVFMNAGAYDGQMADRVVAVRYLDHDGNMKWRSGAASNFGYRRSFYMEQRVPILEVYLRTVRGKQATILQTQDFLMAKRAASQPLEYPSGGSIFKRPEDYYAGKLISDSGLKGCRIGGAVVSQKHAGFIINPEQRASAGDVLQLIRHIQDTVKSEFGVSLELELRLVGDWGGLEDRP